MFYLVSYDIPDTPRRTRIAKILQDFGDRVQYSVFECRVDDILLDKMISRLKKAAKQDEDSVRIYCLCASCEKVIRIIGRGEITKDRDVFIL